MRLMTWQEHTHSLRHIPYHHRRGERADDAADDAARRDVLAERAHAAAAPLIV